MAGTLGAFCIQTKTKGQARRPAPTKNGAIGIGIGTLLYGEWVKCFYDFIDGLIPSAASCLAEEAHGGIPGRIGSIEQPRPIGWLVKQGPGWFAQSAGDMGHPASGRDD